MSPQSHVVFVYQFGKVASTSITNSLNALPGISAHQSHFLGLDALTKMLVRVVDPNISEYFHEHMLGQFIENVKLTHKLASLRTSKGGPHLVVLTLSRAPMDWFQSAVLQDIDGYEIDIRALCPDAAEPIETGLILILRRIGETLEAHGGIEACLADIRANKQDRVFRGTVMADRAIFRQMFLLALRPMLWFEQHFEPCLGVRLDDLPRAGRYWFRMAPDLSILLLRYEDLDDVLTDALDSVGIVLPTPLRRDNPSSAKKSAASVAHAFSSPEALNVAALLQDCDYSRRFEYCKSSVG